MQSGHDGHRCSQTESLAAETKTLPAAAEPAKPEQEPQPHGTDVPSADVAASSAEEKSLSSGSTEAAPPQPQPLGVEPVDPKYIPTCEVKDIVMVRARQRKEYDGCKAKVTAVLTGDVKVEMLEGMSAPRTASGSSNLVR